MADKDIEKQEGAAAGPEKPAAAEAKPIKIESVLPQVESPSVSPADEVVIAPVADAPVAGAPIDMMAAARAETVDPAPPPTEEPARSWFAFDGRAKRHALLAASVTIAASLGVVLGVWANSGTAKPVQPDAAAIAAVNERKAMQQSIARLTSEIVTLKSNLDAANKAAHTQLARINERLKRESTEVTGSIAAPATVSAAPVAPAEVLTPLPQPRPLPRLAAQENQRGLVVPGWSIHEVRDGYVYVQGLGEIYQVVPGAPLPGIGAVESIKRQDGRWIVVTPKGLIVASRDRRHFETF